MTMTTTLRGIEVTELLHMIRAFFDGAGNLIYWCRFPTQEPAFTDLCHKHRVSSGVYGIPIMVVYSHSVEN